MYRKNILTKNTGKINSERDRVLVELRRMGLTYKQIANMFDTKVSRQAIHNAVTRHLERESNKKADNHMSA